MPDFKLRQAIDHHVLKPLKHNADHPSSVLRDFRISLTTGEMAEAIAGMLKDPAIDSGTTFVINKMLGVIHFPSL